MQRFKIYLWCGFFWFYGLAQAATLSPAMGARTGQPYKAEAGPFKVGVIENLVLTDSKRNKNLELRVQYPVHSTKTDISNKVTGNAKSERFSLIIFSHGAGAT